jgi:hypothetical protein
MQCSIIVYVLTSMRKFQKIKFPEALLDNNTHDAIGVLLKTLVLKRMCRLI